MVSENMMHGKGDIMANILPTAGSDHWTICLNWDWKDAILSKPFRFEQFWLEHKDFKDLVSQWWQELVPPPGIVMYHFQ